MNLQSYCLNDLCWVAADTDTIVGRSVDLHLSHFRVDAVPDGKEADITFHGELPTPAAGHIVTAEGLIADEDTVFMDDGQVAIRMLPDRMDVYSRRGMSPHIFIQIFGHSRGFGLFHCAAISYKGRAILLPAWGGVGKTSLIAGVVPKDDFQLLGDDFVFLTSEGTVLPYPLPFSVYHYHRPLFPHLFEEKAKRRGIHAGWLLKCAYPLRPLLIPLLAKHPRLEEWVKNKGRGYRPVPVSEIFPAEKIGGTSPIDKVVSLVRYDGDDFDLASAEPEELIRAILGIVHYEFAGAPLLRYLLTLASFGKLNLADYFERLRTIVGAVVGRAECLSLKIPASAAPTAIGDVFRERVLRASD